jgi:hypothetical protein
LPSLLLSSVLKKIIDYECALLGPGFQAEEDEGCKLAPGGETVRVVRCWCGNLAKVKKVEGPPRKNH